MNPLTPMRLATVPAVVLMLAWSTALPAHAQVEPPVVLGPANGADDEAPADGDGGLAREPLADPLPVPTPAAAADPAVVILGELAEVDPSVVGLLDESQGGFGVAMWSGSNRARVERLLPRLPMGTLSPAMQDLARRLLLSTAAVPEGKALAPSLLGLRVERLMAGGLIADVNELLRLASASLDDPAFARAEVDGMLLAGDNAGACAKVFNLVQTGAASQWIKTLAFCRALEADRASVSMALALLRDQGEAGDEAFFALIGALGGAPEVTISSLIDPAPLHIAMLRAARKTVPPDAVPGARPAILSAIASVPNATIDTRLEAAERAEGAGALTASALAAIYQGVSFTDVELGDAVQRAAGQTGPRVNALLFQVAKVSTDSVVRAAALQAAWQIARREGGFGTSARVNLSATRALHPAPAVVWIAGEAARALLAAGDPEMAWGWLDLATGQAALGDADAARLADRMWPLLQIADPEGAFMRDPDRASNWWRPLLSGEADEDLDGVALVYVLFDALGSPVPTQAWDPLFAAPLTVDGYLPSPAVGRSLDEASRSGRVGETVLLALIALGDAGAEGADAATLFDVITALRRIGLGDEARAIALEAALARGL